MYFKYGLEYLVRDSVGIILVLKIFVQLVFEIIGYKFYIDLLNIIGN